MTWGRRPTEVFRFSAEATARIHSSRDLLRELERARGVANHTQPSGFPLPFDPAELRKQVERMASRLGVDPAQLGSPLGEFEGLEGVRFDDSSIYSTHPILVRAMDMVGTLLRRTSAAETIPELGVVTHNSFNAAAVRYKKRLGASDSDVLVCNAVTIHYPVFWMVTDLCFALCWLTTVWNQRGPEFARDHVIPEITRYVRAFRESLRNGTGQVPPFPPDSLEEDATYASCAVSSWVGATLAVMFVLLHEVAHVQLHFPSYVMAEQSDTCSMFCMTDTHRQEFEADAFAARHMKLLLPEEIYPVLKLNAEQFSNALQLGLIGLFAAIDVFDTRGLLASLIPMPSHPSPHARCYRVMEALGLSAADKRRARGMLVGFRALKAT